MAKIIAVGVAPKRDWDERLRCESSILGMTGGWGWAYYPNCACIKCQMLD